MHKTETAANHPIVEHMARTQALARVEWEAAQRIFDIQSAALRRLMALSDGAGKHREHAPHSAMAGLAGPWAGLYQQTFTKAMEASTISMNTLAQIQAEMINSSHEMLPLLQRELLDGIEQLSRAMTSIPMATAPARHAKNA